MILRLTDQQPPHFAASLPFGMSTRSSRSSSGALYDGRIDHATIRFLHAEVQSCSGDMEIACAMRLATCGCRFCWKRARREVILLPNRLRQKSDHGLILRMTRLRVERCDAGRRVKFASISRTENGRRRKRRFGYHFILHWWTYNERIGTI